MFAGTLSFFNPFPASIPILHPQKTSENQRFSGVFGGREWEHWPEMG